MNPEPLRCIQLVFLHARKHLRLNYSSPVSESVISAVPGLTEHLVHSASDLCEVLTGNSYIICPMLCAFAIYPWILTRMSAFL